MPGTSGKTTGGDLASRSRLISGLLIASLLLVIALAWQAQRATTTHLQTATGVLQDYGRIVADLYARRAMAEIGYSGYFTYVNHLRSHATFPGPGVAVEPPDTGTPAHRAAKLARSLFVINVETDQVVFTGNEAVSAPLRDYLRERSQSFSRSPLPEAGFVVLHFTDEGRSRTFVMTAMSDRKQTFGFEVDRDRLSEWLALAFNREPLLPQALGGGAITNDYVYLRMDDQTGRALFETGPPSDPYLRVSKPLGDEYEGIFSGHTLSAAIDPDIAGSLVIGGLPRSRLPFLVVVMLLTVGLLVTAIRQSQRERSVMRMRTNFVSEVSHELRTPLTQIRMFTETLLFDRVRSNDEKRRALEVINRESQRLIHLVENVLQFANRQTADRQLHLSEHVLAPLLERVVAEFRPLADASNASIVCELDQAAVANVDVDALRQILLNLLHNAVKYGPAGQRIVVSVHRRANWVSIAVSDQGPGIPRADRERIWGGYYRLERERGSAIAGTGIGLAVVRQLVNQHDGKTSVEDAAGGGARFVVELPASRANDDAAKTANDDGPVPENTA